MEESPLNRMVYMSVPENFATEIGDFRVDPGILLPIERPTEDWDLQDLSWEMVIAGMLKVLIYDRENRHKEYYREFVLAVKPDIESELSQGALAQVKEKNFDLAEELFLSLRALYPSQSVHHLNIATMYEERSNIYDNLGKAEFAREYEQRAVTAYSQALSLFPADENVLYSAGIFFLKRSNYPKASSLLKQYLKVSTHKKKRSRVEKVLETLNDTAQQDTLFKEAYDDITGHREQEGIDKIQRFLKDKPEVWNGWFLLGWAYRRQGEYAKAKESFLKALNRGAKGVDIFNELSICLMELGEYSECRKFLTQAVEMEPDNIKILSNLGILHLKEEQYDRAIECFEKVLSLEPEDPIAIQYLSYLQN